MILTSLEIFSNSATIKAVNVIVTMSKKLFSNNVVDNIIIIDPYIDI